MTPPWFPALNEVSEESTTAQLRRTMTTLVRTGSAASKQSSMRRGIFQIIFSNHDG
jgi:hypothetical protein